MDWITTSTLLAGLRDWERETVWRDFAARFRPPLVRFARKIGTPPDSADDVAQESLLVFARAYRDGKYDRSKGRLSSWLFGIAYHQILKQRERDARPERPVGFETGAEDFWNRVPDEKTASGIWQTEWEQFVIRACIDRVRGEFEPATIRIFEQFVKTPDATETAEALDVPVKAVYNAKHRVLNRIREVRADIEESA